MNTDRELMQQAMEALESRGASRELHHHVITALRERLARPLFHLRSHGDVSAEELERLAQQPDTGEQT